jgi:UrcA family protein
MTATKLLAAVAALTALSAAAAPVWAAPDPDQITVRVKVGDLNLDTEHGAQVALSRIRNASHFICGEEPSARQIKEGMLYRSCMHRTVGQAVAMANRPVLTAVAGQLGETTVLAAR